MFKISPCIENIIINTMFNFIIRNYRKCENTCHTELKCIFFCKLFSKAKE